VLEDYSFNIPLERTVDYRRHRVTHRLVLPPNFAPNGVPFRI